MFAVGDTVRVKLSDELSCVGMIATVDLNSDGQLAYDIVCEEQDVPIVTADRIQPLFPFELDERMAGVRAHALPL